jgi:hypothetical protein
MTSRFEPKIDLPAGAVAPDAYDDSGGRVPPDDFVVSRKRDGTPASVYGELSWDRTHYDPEYRSRRLNFRYWDVGDLTPLRDQLSRELRWLMFLLMWKREGSPLAFSTLERYLSALRDLAQFSERHACRIRDLLSDPARLTAYLATDISVCKMKLLSSLLCALTPLGADEIGFHVLGGSTLRELRALIARYKRSRKQHPPIPTRIYSAIIAELVRELDAFDVVADRYLALVAICAKNTLMGRSQRNQRDRAQEHGLARSEYRPEFPALLPKYELVHYFSANDLSCNVTGLSAGLSAVQMAAKLLIQTFSGMREDEARTLPYDCLETSVSNGKTHCLINGRTTKLNKGRIKRTRWVTSQDGHKAIQIAQRIADAIYGALGDKPRKAASRINHYPLFVSTAYLGFPGAPCSTESDRYLAGDLNLGNFPTLRMRLQLPIEDGDLRELEQIDPHRAWRAEHRFQVNQPWVLTSHQLRRSLALYAQRSGLVSLPSLRRQLQHITEEMSRYYARGSAFARDFVGDDTDHFGLEWQDTQLISSALSFLINVVLSDEVLFGGYAHWLHHRRTGADKTVMIDREATLRRFEKGELFYRETMLGGCVKVGDCDQVGLRWLNVDCLKGCRHLVGRLSKLERVIVAQTRLVKTLDPESLEFRTEQADLDVLIAARDRVLQQQRPTAEA